MYIICISYVYHIYCIYQIYIKYISYIYIYGLVLRVNGPPPPNGMVPK